MKFAQLDVSITVVPYCGRMKVAMCQNVVDSNGLTKQKQMTWMMSHNEFIKSVQKFNSTIDGITVKVPIVI